MRKYYERIAAEKPHLGLIVDTVPADFTPEWVREQNEKPGILALAMKEIGKTAEGDPDYQGIPFVVPGARFNELYNVSLSSLCMKTLSQTDSCFFFSTESGTATSSHSDFSPMDT